METRKDFSCGGLVRGEDGRLLVVEVENLSGTRVWTFPKGHPEKGETDEAAALREVHEETGWECRVVRQLMDVDYFFVKDGVRFHKVVRWYLMEPLAETRKPMEGEILTCRWATPAEARSLITYSTDFKLLEKAGL